MNKLAVLTFTILFTLGGLMWFAANNSMNQYLENYVALINQKLSDTAKLSISDIRTSPGQGLGEAINISLSSHSKKQHYPQLNIERLVWQFEKKTLKKETVKVSSIVITKMNVSLERTNPLPQLVNVSQILEKQIAEAISRKAGLDGNKEFQVSIDNIIIENLYITLYDEAIPVEEKIASDIKLSSAVLEQSNQMSIAAANVMISLITQIEVELLK